MKKVISLLMTFCLIVGICPVFASASAAYILICSNFSSYDGGYSQIHYGVNEEGDFGTIRADWSWDKDTCTLTLGDLQSFVKGKIKNFKQIEKGTGNKAAEHLPKEKAAKQCYQAGV